MSQDQQNKLARADGMAVVPEEPAALCCQGAHPAGVPLQNHLVLHLLRRRLPHRDAFGRIATEHLPQATRQKRSLCAIPGYTASSNSSVDRLKTPCRRAGCSRYNQNHIGSTALCLAEPPQGVHWRHSSAWTFSPCCTLNEQLMGHTPAAARLDCSRLHPLPGKISAPQMASVSRPHVHLEC